MKTMGQIKNSDPESYYGLKNEIAKYGYEKAFDNMTLEDVMDVVNATPANIADRLKRVGITCENLEKMR